MAFTKITENDTINKGVIGLPDTPNLSTAAMQAKFEELSNDVIIPKFNNLVDELEAKSAAGNTGATIPSGINAESENVQAVLNGIAEKAHTHEKSDAELTDAVTKAHEHSNKSVIDKFTENESGVPLYNGEKMTGDAFKKVKVGDKYITAKDYDTIEFIAGDNVIIDADTENKTLKLSAVGGSGGGGGDMYKAVYDKDNDGMVDNAKTVGSLDNLNTTNQENVVGAINEVIADRQIKTYLSPTLMDSTKNWTNYALKDLKAGRCLMASLSETTDISNAYTNGVIPVQKAGTLKGINVNNNGFYQYFTIDGEQYINSCSNFVANTFTGWNKFDVDTLTTLEQVTASTDVSKPVGAGAVQELNNSLGDISNIGNDTYNSVEKLLQYYIDKGYLPDINSIALIPIMTSDNTPSGICYASYLMSGRKAFWAFNGLEPNFSTGANYWHSESSGKYIQYTFQDAKTINKVKLKGTKYGQNGNYTITVLCGSSESSLLEVGTLNITNSTTSGEEKELAITPVQNVKVIRFVTSNQCAIWGLQAYGS